MRVRSPLAQKWRQTLKMRMQGDSQKDGQATARAKRLVVRSMVITWSFQSGW